MKQPALLMYLFAIIFNRTRNYLIAGILLTMSLPTLHAQHVPVGSLNDFKANLKMHDEKGRLKSTKERIIPTPKGNLQAIIQLNQTDNGTETFAGEIKGSKGSNITFTIKGTSLEGLIVNPKDRKAFRYYSNIQGDVIVNEEDIHKVMCIEYGQQEALASTAIALTVPPSTSSVYKLQSFPGAVGVIYLDFDGQVVQSSRWNGGNTIIAQPGNFTDVDITNIWKMVSEDYRPFNINITTDSTVFYAAAKNRRQRTIFTPNDAAAPGSGGVSYISSFNWNEDTPNWVFNAGVKGAGEAASHENGHAMGLSHDGRTNPQEGYYAGQGIWAPIMGVGYSKSLVQWSKGEYAYANNTEDDVAIISNTTNGVGYRTDEAGNTNTTAKALSMASGVVNSSANYGIITTRTDIDVYSFTTSGGTCSLTVNPSPSYPDLDLLVTLTDANGNVISTANPTSTLSAAISTTLAAGTYYLQVDGTGQGDPVTDGYSDYASIGEYTISGTIAVSGTNQAPVVSITSPVNGATFTAPASITINANATDSDGSISKVEFYNGTTLLGTSTSSPYSFSWSNVAAGSYTISAKAYDNAGASTSSSTITISVKQPNQAPSVSFTSPSNGSSYTAPATVSLTANASDVDGTITKVEFYTGTQLIGTASASPYSVTWTNVAAGSYTLYAKAYDNLGATTNSSTVTISVTSTNNQPPTVNLTSPANGATFNAPATITISANATDTDGTISKVEFYNGSALIGTASASPYTISWTNVATGSYTIMAKAFDNGGATTSSASVSITVNQSTGCHAPTNLGAKNITTASATLTWEAIPGVTNYQVWWHTLNGTWYYRTVSTNSAYVTNLKGSTTYEFTVRAYCSGAYTAYASPYYRFSTLNALPTVSLTSPTSGQSFTAPATVTLTANANDLDGTVAKVEFFHGSTKLGEDVTSPYSYTWTNVAAGTYYITAKATDNKGGSRTTSSLNFVVTAPAAIFADPSNIESVSVTAAPNPFKDQTSITLNNGEKIISVKILKVDGTEVESLENINAESVSIGNSLKSGLYILRIATEKSFYVKNLIKTE